MSCRRPHCKFDILVVRYEALNASLSAVFDFLREGAAGRAAVANDELRVEDQLKHLPASVIGAVGRGSFGDA